MKTQAAASNHTTDDCHLRSCSAVRGSPIHATDGDIGHIENVLVDDHTWAIRYLIVDTSHWWGGHRVLVAPQWIDAVERVGDEEYAPGQSVTRRGCVGPVGRNVAASTDARMTAEIRSYSRAQRLFAGCCRRPLCPTLSAALSRRVQY